MTYRVSQHPVRGHRWWLAGEVLSDEETNVRRTSPAETRVIDQIMAQDAAGKMPDLALGEQIRELMQAYISSKPLFMPSLRYLDRSKETVRDNTMTIHYEVMELWDFDYVTETDDNRVSLIELRKRGLPAVYVAEVSSERYQEWIRLYHPPGEILPHISFGGAVVATPEGDGGAGKRAWDEYAKEFT